MSEMAAKTAPQEKSVAEIYGNAGWFGRFLRTKCFCPGLRAQAVNLLQKEGGVIYDMCCGTGENFPYLSRAVGPSGQVYAIDITRGMVADAKRRCRREKYRNISVELGDASEYRPPECPDGILMSFCYDLLPNSAEIVRNAYDLLKAGGKLVVIDAKVPDALEILAPRVKPMIYSLFGSDPTIKAWQELPKLLSREGVMQRKFWDTHFLYHVIK